MAFPDVGDIRVFVLCPCVSRLAQVAVVRHGVQTPLQTSPRLVPTYQGRQPGHRLHRGNAHTDRRVHSLRGSKTSPLVWFHSLLSCEWKSMVLHDFWITPQTGGYFNLSARVDAVISSCFTWRPFRRPGSNHEGKCLFDWTGDWKGRKRKMMKARGLIEKRSRQLK